MNYLLDTCILSELVKKKPEISVVRWMESHQEPNLYISALTLGELQRGVSRLPKSKRKDQLKRWLLDELTSRFQHRVVQVDGYVALTWGRLLAEAERNGRHLASIDGLLAASAISHGLVLVTRNIKDFQIAALQVINPWEQ